MMMMMAQKKKVKMILIFIEWVCSLLFTLVSYIDFMVSQTSCKYQTFILHDLFLLLLFNNQAEYTSVLDEVALAYLEKNESNEGF